MAIIIARLIYIYTKCRTLLFETRRDNFNLNENMSGADSSDSCSDGEMEAESSLPVFTPSGENTNFSNISPPPSPFSSKNIAQSSSNVTTATSTSSTSTKPSTSLSSPTLLPPLVYQTSQGMMYATAPSGAGGVLLSLSQPDSNSAHPQFITIPLSMVNGQCELDLSKRK